MSAQIKVGSRIFASYKDEALVRELIVSNLSSNRVLVTFVGYGQWFRLDKWHIVDILDDTDKKIDEIGGEALEANMGQWDFI